MLNLPSFPCCTYSIIVYLQLYATNRSSCLWDAGRPSRHNSVIQYDPVVINSVCVVPGNTVNTHTHHWLVVEPPLWRIKSVGIIIPNIWKVIKIHGSIIDYYIPLHPIKKPWFQTTNHSISIHSLEVRQNSTDSWTFQCFPDWDSMQCSDKL